MMNGSRQVNGSSRNEYLFFTAQGSGLEEADLCISIPIIKNKITCRRKLKLGEHDV